MPEPDKMPDSRPILIVLHQEWSTPGRVGQMLEAKGRKLDIRKPVMGDPLPETMDDHAGAIIFGGPMSANANEDFIKKEIDWVSVPLRDKAPFFGICLGAQMLAKQLGAGVTKHDTDFAEIGYYQLEPTEEGKTLMANWPGWVYHWHTEGFELPSGAELLARGGNEFPNQAYRYGPSAMAVQFHAELTLRMMYRWTTLGDPWLVLPGARPRKEHFEGRMLHDGPVRAWLDQFLDRWLETDQREAA